MPPINPKDKINRIKKKSSFNKKGPQSIGIYFLLFIIVLGLYGFIFHNQHNQLFLNQHIMNLLSKLKVEMLDYSSTTN